MSVRLPFEDWSLPSNYKHSRLGLPSANSLLPGRQRWHTAFPQFTRILYMRREYHRWHSPRLGMELGVVAYGHWGPPLMGFPTSAGDEWELEGQSMVGALADFIDAGRIKFYTVN